MASSFGFSRHITSTRFWDTNRGQTRWNGQSHHVLAVGGDVAANQENVLLRGEAGDASLFLQRLHGLPKVFHDLETEQTTDIEPEAD